MQKSQVIFTCSDEFTLSGSDVSVVHLVDGSNAPLKPKKGRKIVVIVVVIKGRAS